MMNVIERVHALSEHLCEMSRHAGGYGPVPQPDTEHARAIVEAYWLLLDENERQRQELAVVRAGEWVLALDETSPALARWRELILKSSRRSPLERAAAWELTAIIMDAHGELQAADIARENANDAIPPTSTVAEAAA